VRDGTLKVRAVIAGIPYELINISVRRSYFLEEVAEALQVFRDGAGLSLGIGNCETTNPPSCYHVYPNPALRQSYNHRRDNIDYNPITIAEINDCPTPEGEDPPEDDGPTPDDGTYREISPNGLCERCVVYRNGELFCVGDWQDIATGGACEDPGEAQPPSEVAPPTTDKTPPPVDPPDDGDQTESPIDVPWEDMQAPVFPERDPASEYDFPWHSDGTPTPYAEAYARNNPHPDRPDVDETRWNGPLPGDMAGIVNALLYAPVEFFDTWQPPDLIRLVTGGAVCPEPPTP